MRRRFVVSALLSVPLVLVAMLRHLWMGFGDVLPHGVLDWIELALATPVVLWGGWPFFARGWQSIVNRYPNMFTLIAAGTGVAWTYSLVAVIAPHIFPRSDEHTSELQSLMRITYA